MSEATLILDNEAVQALIDPAHRKHRWVVSSVLLAVRRNRDQAASVRLIVPTAVRVESAWDRRTRSAAAVNRLRFEDAALDSRAANRAAAVRSTLGVSVSDAHIAAVLGDTKGPHAVVTSDRPDIGRIATHLGIKVEIVPV
jgi:predicted nucleic acid-binding protein